MSSLTSVLMLMVMRVLVPSSVTSMIKHTDQDFLKVQKLSQCKKSRSIEDLDKQLLTDKNDPDPCATKTYALTE